MAVTTEDVAALLPSRPKLPGGTTLLDFSELTYPKQSQVQDRIDRATTFLYAKTGQITDPSLATSAEHLVSLYAAMLTELGFYPEQVNNDKSPYKELKKLYDEGFKALIEALGGDGDSVIDDDEIVSALMPDYAFPKTSIGDGIMP